MEQKEINRLMRLTKADLIKKLDSDKKNIQKENNRTRGDIQKLINKYTFKKWPFITVSSVIDDLNDIYQNI